MTDKQKTDLLKTLLFLAKKNNFKVEFLHAYTKYGAEAFDANFKLVDHGDKVSIERKGK
jgi:hypothetical protein